MSVLTEEEQKTVDLLKSFAFDGGVKKKALDLITRLAAELEEAKARLDWMITNNACVAGQNNVGDYYITICDSGPFGEGKTPEEAIDAARRKG